MIINTNVQALISCKALANSGKKLSKYSDRLSSGKKVNSSGDNPSAFAVSRRLRAQIASLEMADRNTNDAVSLTQTIEGGLTEIQSITQRIREISVQASTDTMTPEDRDKLKLEVEVLVEEVDGIAKRCSFNGVSLLDGTNENLIFQVGQDAGNTIDLDLINASSESLGFNELKFDTIEDWSNIITTCDKALSTISDFRTGFGSFINRLDYVYEGIQTSNENMKKFLSVIEDTDMAEEMIKYTTENVISQSSMAMLAQANERPDELLGLMR